MRTFFTKSFALQKCYNKHFLNIRLIFRHIPDVPPNTRRHTITSQLLSFNSKIDSTSLTQLSNKMDKSSRTDTTIDVSTISSLSITHSSSAHSLLNRSTSLTIDRNDSFSSSCSKIDRLVSNKICPLCQTPFDTVGIYRPVADACGHTTCFQCFKTMMIKATGCSLCQKEEELNSQLSDQTCDSVNKIQ